MPHSGCFFFDILMHPGAKTLGFGIPLAPSWDANGAQFRAFFGKIAEGKLWGYSKIQGLQKRATSSYKSSLSERSWAPFWLIWDGF